MRFENKEIVIEKNAKTYNDYYNEFKEFIDESQSVEVYLRGKTHLTNKEIDLFLSKYIKEDGQFILKEISKINQKLKDFEENIKNEKEIPSEIIKLCKKSTKANKLTKVLMQKARRLAIQWNHLNPQDHVKEFNYRFFEPENIELAKKRNVPIKKNYWNLIRTQLINANKGCKYYSSYDSLLDRNVFKIKEKGQVERDLGMDFDDVFSLLCSEVIENVYFYEKSIAKLDTYVFESIKLGLQKIRNIPKYIDSKGGKRERKKDSVIEKKIAKLKYLLEEENKEVNVENLWAGIKEENKKIKYKNDKISKEELKKVFQFTNSYLSLNELELGDEGKETTNDVIFNEIWEKDGNNSFYNPLKKVKDEELNKGLKKIVYTTIKEDNEEEDIIEKEKIVYELMLENIVDKGNFNIDLDEFNDFYSNKLGNSAISKKELVKLQKNVIKRIKKNKNVFKQELDIIF